MTGRFIVLEGVDGAGTTTHSQRLTSNLKQEGVPVHLTAEPSTGPIGALLRQTLTGRMVMNDSGGARPPSWNTMALLFAADRLDHVENELSPSLADGATVVCDRYYHSSVAYQSLTGGAGVAAIAWIRELNRYARRPDLTIVLDVPAEVAAERRRRRRGNAEIYDDAELQQALCGFYLELERHFPEERIVHVSADAPLDQVAARLLELARSVG
jgi:dTMP kinase